MNLCTRSSASALHARSPHRSPPAPSRGRAACRSPARRSRCVLRQRGRIGRRPALIDEGAWSCPGACHSAWHTCGTMGESTRTAISRASWRTARPGALTSLKRRTAFSSSMTAAIAVLKLRRRPMSSVTLASVWCATRRSSRCAPFRAVELQGRCRHLRARARRPRSTGGAGSAKRPARPHPTIPGSARAARRTS